MRKILTALTMFLSLTSFAETLNTPPEQILCSDLSDQFCNEIWSDQNKGNLKTKDGSLSLGTSQKSDLAQVVKIDTEIFLNSLTQLPQELREDKNYMALAEKLKQHMASENPSKQWMNEYNVITTQLSNELNLIGNHKLVAIFPHLKDVPVKEYNYEESRKDWELYDDLVSRLTEAKYANSPAWLRVQRIFEEVRNNLFVVIEKTSLSQAKKAALINKLKTVELTLPYNDGDRLNSDPSCAFTSTNAFYDPIFNKATLCMGSVNSQDSFGGLVNTIAHELSHAIDFPRQSFDKFQTYPLVKKLRPLVRSEKPITSCKAWNKLIASGVFSEPKSYEQDIDPEFTKFLNCIMDKSSLKPFTKENLTWATDQKANAITSDNATQRIFSFLATPLTKKKGVYTKNDYYLRPDLLNNSWNHFKPYKKYILVVPTTYFFTYSLICSPGEDKPRDFASLPIDEKKQLFQKAVKEATRLTDIFLQHEYLSCGTECPDLIEYNLAKPSGENFADWMTSRVSVLSMKKLSDEDKVIFAKEMGSSFCDRPEYEYDKTLMVEEKYFSREVHEDSRIRRWSYFSPELAKEAKCKIPKTQVRSFNLCEL